MDLYNLALAQLRGSFPKRTNSIFNKIDFYNDSYGKNKANPMVSLFLSKTDYLYAKNVLENAHFIQNDLFP